MDKKKYHDIPKEELPKGVSFRRVYGQRDPNKKPKFSEAPNQAKIIPLVER